MKDFIYTGGITKVSLYEISEGKQVFVKEFHDRNDMLLYLEEQYDYCRVTVISEYC